jgi:hypothetical protein
MTQTQRGSHSNASLLTRGRAAVLATANMERFVFLGLSANLKNIAAKRLHPDKASARRSSNK